MTYYLVIVKEGKQKTLDKMKLYANSPVFKNVPLGMSPDNEITNIIGKRGISTDKSIF